MIPVPKGQSRAYLMPVARVMRLYRHHIGSHALSVSSVPDGLDVVGSRRDQTIFLHVANTRRGSSVKTRLRVEGIRIDSGQVFQIADDPMVEVSHLNSAEVMQVRERPLGSDGTCEFPPASVSAVELKLAAVGPA
jgi:hypothetical protein